MKKQIKVTLIDGQSIEAYIEAENIEQLEKTVMKISHIGLTQTEGHKVKILMPSQFQIIEYDTTFLQITPSKIIKPHNNENIIQTIGEASEKDIVNALAGA